MISDTIKKGSGKYDNFFITDLYLIEAKGMWVFMAGIICPRCRHQTFFKQDKEENAPIVIILCIYLQIMGKEEEEKSVLIAEN